MIKFLVIFFILLLVVMLLVIRYRRQLKTALYIWQAYKQMKKTPKKSAQKEESTQKINKGEALVRCARCGKWVQPSNAVKLRGNTIYCSTQCMEKAARLESLVDKN